VAKLCAEADRQLSRSQKRFLLEELPFHRSIFSKLAKIGRTEHLYDAEVLPRLPASYSTIHELSKLKPRAFKAALDGGIVRPDMHRRDAKS
jgi:hypothetical protein